MTIPGLRFVEPKTPEAALNVRADIALFVGFVRLRGPSIPKWMRQQWHDLGLRPDEKQLADSGLKLPIRFESFAQFNEVFDPDWRVFDPAHPATLVPSALGLAVRSFFAEGGINCYVVRCGDPLPALPMEQETTNNFLPSRKNLIDNIIQRHELRFDDPASWIGISHVLGLEDVSMLLLPDLAEFFAIAPAIIPDKYVQSRGPAVFLPAGQPVAEPYKAAPSAQPYSAPRLDENGRKLWAQSIANVLSLLSKVQGGASRRDVQLIATLPLPTSANLELEKSPDVSALLANVPEENMGQLQLVYPWIQTAASAMLPERLQGGEGVVAGIIARNAVTRGAFMSIAGQRSTTMQALSPTLLAANINKQFNDGAWLGDRLTLLSSDEQGFLMLSDSTFAKERPRRSGSLRRLTGIVLRVARLAGEDLVFEANLPSTWTRLRHRIEDYLTELWSLGAFDGETPRDAFFVRCGPATMSQNDIDAGRIIAEISFMGMQPIEWMTVTLELGVAQPRNLRAA